jgi:hypothetical protein
LNLLFNFSNGHNRHLALPENYFYTRNNGLNQSFNRKG